MRRFDSFGGTKQDHRRLPQRCLPSVPNQKFGAEVVAGWMRRKAEEEAASRANGDDENAARRRPGAEI
jgi:hypothetical protein